MIAPSSIFEDGFDICLLSPERALQPVSKHPLAGGFGERALGVFPLQRRAPANGISPSPAQPFLHSWE